ncbi:helix-turn-helix domain-containing protein [Pseudosulfitobacter pseudonitzschiae]|uniref:XRE family transcriptional regulator n=1 Tax=Pseudosulfitobacter pseudonitzschiae TaxID=1402135 RepID=A0A073J2V4_9RHOB|nr:helix-turn-helix transcriptional regulator [Pseudosulfitobacter pseudonitzschiae]KEJ96324.1 XRE family transcriptional regulator [Pseudosulfitobacter pseudonitzschiae]MBM1813810.1 helix-turn-helix transcriptional regulator [Pseudosulfitobacter pseudonitzschiae]MBM1830803.1 helix-turn-helix transcriptional regulator [Pseudosulfitobacter pseudonitzschiae]MBM1835670.1 helix-turn-helix transcriptional regulator [Pseudosulfitobacter pseudonitzschiae]MBM1840516.1 helix-turn-helix transcriptional 
MTDDSTDWYSQDAATFGDRVAAAREAADLSQKELARRLGVRLSTVRGWEDDRSEPRANRLSMMAGLLNVSMMWLINGEGDGLPAPDEDPLPRDMRLLLADLRTLRADLVAKAEQVARMEKTLRQIVQETPDV